MYGHTPHVTNIALACQNGLMLVFKKKDSSPSIQIGFVDQCPRLIHFGKCLWCTVRMAKSKGAPALLCQGAVTEPHKGGRERRTSNGIIGRGHGLAI